MAEKNLECPVCGLPGALECADEVDIGVGVQRHVFGYECLKCGQISICSGCGAPESEGIATPHAAWCNYAPGN